MFFLVSFFLLSSISLQSFSLFFLTQSKINNNNNKGMELKIAENLIKISLFSLILRKKEEKEEEGTEKRNFLCIFFFLFFNNNKINEIYLELGCS